MNKRKVINFLISFVVFLLLLNVLIASLTKAPNQVIKKNEETIEQIEKKFFNVFNNFGLKQKWIEKRIVKKGLYDSLKHFYNLKVPVAVSIPVIIKDLNEQFANQTVKIESSELKSDGSTKLTVFSNNIVKFICKMNYSSDISRAFSKAAFLIDDFESLNEIEREQFYSIPVPCGIILALEANKQILASEIKKNKKQYFIELNNDVDDMDYELNEDIGLKRLTENVNSIISHFNSPRAFFINPNKKYFNESIQNYIVERFKKRGRFIKYTNQYNLIKGENSEDLHSLINFHLNTLAFGDTKVFRISAQDWFKIQGEIIKYQKKGNKIVFPTYIF